MPGEECDAGSTRNLLPTLLSSPLAGGMTECREGKNPDRASLALTVTRGDTVVSATGHEAKAAMGLWGCCFFPDEKGQTGLVCLGLLHTLNGSVMAGTAATVLQP